MRILLWPVQYLPEIGGLENLVSALVHEFLKRGLEIMIIASHDKPSIEKQVEQSLTIWRVPFKYALFKRDLGLVKEILATVKKLIVNFSPDVVNIHGWIEYKAFYQIRILNELNYPIVLTIHGLLEQERYNYGACDQLWKSANYVTFVSHFLAREIVGKTDARNKYAVIHNALVPVTKPRSEMRLPIKNLLMIGRLTEEKCFDLAFSSLANIIGQFPDVRLKLLGSGYLYDHLNNLRCKLGLMNSIEMIGWVQPSKVYDYIDQADLILVPSYYESFSLVALQAAMRGRVVIASNVGGLPEVISDNHTGYLVPANDAIALAEKIRYVLMNQAEVIEVGRQAAIRADIQFNIENTVYHYLKTYVRVMNHETKRKCDYSLF